MNPGDSDKSMKWIYPDQEPPPRGVKIALLTEGNIQTTGNWTDDGRFKAWQRLFSRDKEHEKQVLSDRLMRGIAAMLVSPKQEEMIERIVTHRSTATQTLTPNSVCGVSPTMIIIDELGP